MKVPETIRAKLESSLEQQIIQLIDRDYSMVAGDKVRNMFAEDIVAKVRKLYREPNLLEVGQLQWIGVDKGERPSYGKNTRNTRFTPVVLTAICKDDIEMMANGYSHREVRERKIVRLFHEADDQGALLTNADVAMVLGVSAGTISKQAREYMERENKVLPTRGIVHDIGRAVTHKRIIVRLYLEGHLVPDIARMTGHSEEAVDRYIRAFSKVRMLRDKMDPKGISSTLEMSQFLVKEYLEILEDHEKGGLIDA